MSDSSTSNGSDDTVPPMQPSPPPTSSSSSTSAHTRRGHRSMLSSIDMTEESRDTVDESDVWYPQFSAAATLKPVHKLDEEKQTGLRNLLEARMDRRTFEDRFLKPHGDASSSSSSSTSSPGRSVADKEASSESLFNRTAKLGALLANRPDRARLESLNIMKTPQGHASASFALKQKQLETSKRKDRLNSFLSARPSFEDVKRKGIVLERQEASRPQEKVSET